ncbi:cuticle protein CP14.6 [Drosophila guanche]|uniref:Blast:Endocuticle structural glycoprotein SgAbd-2 n=1 Tax=Drosophila guanche TaxID=7266 RepID=A0A3B0J170_DROGU|nr:cuticle protein CP14.6 [Drosophila guanche]XP_034141157.1 cuticle protein CP14.6 [Drosophila guanche]SPP74577.1 blast:Endocuticle structural glycoprotein SgAbd-2 [Drosophila guanche]
MQTLTHASFLALALVLCCLGAIHAQPQRGLPPPRSNSFDANAVILKQNFDLNPDGSYQYNYETSNGIRADEAGYLKNPGTQVEAQVMQGSYSYTGPDGVVYTITYIADENGYRAEGAHIPTPPPVRAANAPGRFFK